VQAEQFITYLQNHDQVANTLQGRRLHQLTSPARLRALTALWLLSPQTPLLFMGQEFSASAPFPFFADHSDELRGKVHAGRREFVGQFSAYGTPAAQQCVPDPAEPATFASARLDFGERETHAPIYRFHRDLLRLRREDPVVARQDRFALDGAVLGDQCLVLRWFDSAGDRLLLVNLGAEVDLAVAPEPLLAPEAGADWELRWSSEDPRYDGLGVAPVHESGRWQAPAEQACFFVSQRQTGAPDDS
jgi:maltooligosyltrehalose trehalohydrolase